MDETVPTICIVGSGAAGLAAALAAAESAHAQSLACQIVLIDRARQGEHGGNTRFSPSYMRLAAPDRIAPGFEDDLNATSGGRMDKAYVRRLAADAPATMAWLMGHGIAFDRPVYYLSAGPPRIQPVGGGAAVLRELERAARNAGVAMRHGCKAERLLIGSTGALEGVEVRTDSGSGETIKAHAVVLASGGFAGNGDMLAQHLGPGADSLTPISPGTRFNTGDGIRMALAAGARAAGDWNGMHAEPVDPRSRNSAAIVLVYPYGIVVDATGKRFFDEGGGLVHETWETFARAIHFATPGRIAYAILDAKLYDIANYQRAIRSEVPPHRADTIPELAALIGVPAAALQQTVADCNAAANGDPAGFDATRMDGLAADAGLSPPKSNWCRRLDRPPYLAYPLIGAVAYTFGGIETNADAEVLGAGGPIRGLFAAGEITGHFYGTAPNAVAMLRALVFGRIAGLGAVAYGLRRYAPRLPSKQD
jgi:tricarballylate dehydrogenase